MGYVRKKKTPRGKLSMLTVHQAGIYQHSQDPSLPSLICASSPPQTVIVQPLQTGCPSRF